MKINYKTKQVPHHTRIMRDLVDLGFENKGWENTLKEWVFTNKDKDYLRLSVSYNYIRWAYWKEESIKYMDKDKLIAYLRRNKVYNK